MERAFDISGLAIGAGANFVARSTVYHVPQLARLIAQAIRTEGMGVVEAMTYCHVTHGRRNEMPQAIQNMNWLKENAISVERARREGVNDRLVIGVLADREYSEYITDYDRLVEELSSPSGREKVDATFL
jgi:2-oxoglutarate ferredoxin oxidoreductase subunit beta